MLLPLTVTIYSICKRSDQQDAVGTFKGNSFFPKSEVVVHFKTNPEVC